MSDVLKELETARALVAELELKAAEALKEDASKLLGKAAAYIALNDAAFRASILEKMAKYSGILTPEEASKVQVAFKVEVKQKRAYNKKPKAE